MLGTAASSITMSEGRPGRIETKKSGAVIFFKSSSIMTSLAICRRFEAIETLLHVDNAAFETCRQCLIRECRANNGCDDFRQVRQTLDGIGQSLLVDVGVFGANAITDGTVGNGGKIETHANSIFTLTIAPAS